MIIDQPAPRPEKGGEESDDPCGMDFYDGTTSRSPATHT